MSVPYFILADCLQALLQSALCSVSYSNWQFFQYKQYQHIYIDFFNIIQLALDTEWIINSRRWSTQCFTGENVCWPFKKQYLVEVTFTELSFSNPSMYIEIDTCIQSGRRVIFTSLNFLISNCAQWDILLTRMVLRAKRGGPGLLQVQKYASFFHPDSNTLIPQECPHHYLRKKRRSEKKQLLAKPIY